jgi:hypothetical protein
MPYFFDPLQQAALQHQQWGALGSTMFNPAMLPTYGQSFGQVGQFGLPALSAFSPAWGTHPAWQPIAQQYWQNQPWQNQPWQQQPWQQQPTAQQFWQQPWQPRQLTQQDVGDVVRQLVPMLPQILGQAQPATMGYGYGQRSLTQQDVNEVVRQILPIVPQVAAALQGQAPAVAAIHAGYGAYGLQNPFAQNLFAQNPWAQATFAGQNPFAQMAMPQLLQQQPFGQPGWPQFQSAFGGMPNWSQRTLTPNDVNDVVRQLVTIIPQAIANLQTLNHQRVI